MLQDLRYALRQLIKSPGFTFTAVISLALGIGATSAVFSVIYAALLNPYPYPAADRIVRLTVNSKAASGDWINLNGPQIQQLRKSPVVESVLAMDYHALMLTGHDFPENVNAIGLISTGFRDLGVPAAFGRGLLPSDAIDGHEPEPVVVLSYKFWQKHFFSNPDTVGKKLELDHKTYTIVGIAAPRFTWYSPDIFLPLKLTQNPALRFIVDIRLRPGVTRLAANAALQLLLTQFAKDMPKQYPEHFKVQVEGLNDWVVKGMSGTLYLLFGAVALLLAIGCANVSILLLARGAARQHELAVRSAIGANRSRMIRQLLTESLLLATFGAALGVLASYGILAGIQLVLPKYAFAPEVVIHINLPVLLFSVFVALLTGALFGLWPALQLSRTQLGQVMQLNARRVAGSVRSRRTHNTLVAAQISLTLLLLTGAGSAMEGFVHLMHTPLGYDPHNVMSVAIPLHDNSYTTWASRAAYFEALRAKISQTPGVTMAAISNNATPPRNGWNTRFELLGKPAKEQPLGSINLVSAEFFSVLRMPLLQGRLWTAAESHAGAHVALINKTLAQRYFPEGGALGHSVKIPGTEDRPPVVLSTPQLADSWLTIIGIVGDSRNDGLRNPIKPAVYMPFTLSMSQGTQVLTRSAVPPLSLVHTVRTQLTSLNPDQQTYNPEDLETWISDEPEWQQEHLAAWIFALFAALALVLAAVGLFSVVSYTVAQRTNEFGIRMALGAQRLHVLRIVFASTIVSVGSGILAGLALSVGLNQIIARWAEGNARDPLILLWEHCCSVWSAASHAPSRRCAPPKSIL